MKTDFPAPLLTFRPLLGAASLALVVGAAAQSLNPLDSNRMEEDDSDSLPAMEMLIEGSVLRKVMIPQYDESRRLASLLRADKLTMVHDGLINAKALRLEFYNPDRSPKARIDLDTARLEDQRILRSSDPVSLISDELNAKGTGLVYELETSRGFLIGPAEASALIDTRTTMNTTPIQRSVIAGAMIAGAAVAPGEGLNKLDDQEIAGLNQLAVSKEAEAKAAADEAADSIDRSSAQSKQADATLSDFLRKSSLNEYQGKTPDLTTKVPDPSGGMIKEPATFSAEDGIYFDSEQGLLVFLKNVVAKHPEFTLTGADEVKVFLDKEEKEEGAKAEKVTDKEAGKLMGGAKFGDPSKIIATGTIVVEKVKTKPGDKGAKASGRQMVFDFKTNELIIRGGQPWIMSDTANGRVVDPEGYIRINVETGDASFVGDSKGFIETAKKNN